MSKKNGTEINIDIIQPYLAAPMSAFFRRQAKSVGQRDCIFDIYPLRETKVAISDMDI